MKDNICFTQIVLLIDVDSNIKSVYFDRENKVKFNNIYDVLKKESVEGFNDFISHINKYGYAPDYLLSLNLDGTFIKLLSTGVKQDDNMILFFFNDLFETVESEIIKINNEHLNTLRVTIKEVEDHNSHKILTDQKILREISELNNQLISTQRELAKKNIEFKILNDKLNKLSITDPLTGLYNRRHFFNEINDKISKARIGNYKLCMISIDINNFKKINDTFGHEEGDRVLKEFAKEARIDLTSHIDSVYRFGGDEFVILILNSDIKYAQKIVENLSASIKDIHEVLSLSYGIAEIDTNEKIDVENLLAAADKKMYEYKRELKKSQI